MSGLLEFSDFGFLGFWDFGIFGFWVFGILGSREVRVGSQDFEISGS